ncbi:hypothetical protein M8756_14295 [Lutimaribacter sp. EGI FJ00015]|uniref:Uncharacterized protein n=1 Tax=Lutimaribacter degradans TaxID=2945989 RepID=A0ACC5ZYN6_9RHOB|nr:hypothetical protein [Lutimaribacter sp. EGI FJ00013]MCM2563191.1 hypothetical protein [Lutimaribacter sp. EGI FJ00013]MCO0614486.1 hypothetical protein [Lutimaribacter sp. EGI FJ00015]MCO0635913.1 hypothetical protein [Lutimaribacter sp. EGI FJ00014]
MGRNAIFILLLWAGVARAEVPSLFQQAALVAGGSTQASNGTSASLFAGRAAGSLFASPEPNTRAHPRVGISGPVAHLLSLIAKAEAGRAGYDAVQAGAQVKPTQIPTRMTLGQIHEWIQATPGQPHAIGRYQFIPTTLRRVARERGFGPDTVFSPTVQDAMAVSLLEEAGFRAFKAGTLDRHKFMRNLARIWAGLPLPNGKSYYHGYAGNRATLTWSRFETEMQRIWPNAG